jgi:hypothetical protein
MTAAAGYLDRMLLVKIDARRQNPVAMENPAMAVAANPRIGGRGTGHDGYDSGSSYCFEHSRSPVSSVVKSKPPMVQRADRLNGNRSVDD